MVLTNLTCRSKRSLKPCQGVPASRRTAEVTASEQFGTRLSSSFLGRLRAGYLVNSRVPQAVVEEFCRNPRRGVAECFAVFWEGLHMFCRRSRSRLQKPAAATENWLDCYGLFVFCKGWDEGRFRAPRGSCWPGAMRLGG